MQTKQGEQNKLMSKPKKQQAKAAEEFLIGKTIISVDKDGIWLDDFSILKWSGKLTIEALPPGTIIVKSDSE